MKKLYVPDFANCAFDPEEPVTPSFDQILTADGCFSYNDSDSLGRLKYLGNGSIPWNVLIDGKTNSWTIVHALNENLLIADGIGEAALQAYLNAAEL